MVQLTINGVKIETENTSTVLQACRENDIEIPTLCHLEDLPADGSCRLCLVEIEGARTLMTACSTPVVDGMKVVTDSERVIESRKFILDLLLSEHNTDCFNCKKAAQCKLREYCIEYGVKTTSYEAPPVESSIDSTNPFFELDRSKCILCRKCVRVCTSKQCTGAYSISQRGFSVHVTPAFEEDMINSRCVSCGNCVSNCPTGALSPKKNISNFDTKILTTCSYCGVGCQLYLIVKNNKIIGIEPANGAANEGLLCVKGKFAFDFVSHKDRLKTPLIKKDGKFVNATWEEAYNLITKKISETKEHYGSDAIAGLSSARCTNEENYTFQKFFRSAIGTNNIDHCARLCHASTVAGLAITLGSGAMTNSIKEIENQEVIFITGSNPTEAHPVIGAKIRQAKRKGAKLIVAEPREIELAEEAEIFLQIRPGTNIALYNAMLNAVMEAGLVNQEYIDTRCENFDEIKDIIKEYTPERASEICGVPADKIREAAKLYASASTAGIYYAMGVTQFSTGTQGVIALSNLALAVGKLGKESCGVNPLRGQNNVQGACDMGALPGDLPGYQKVFHADSLSKFKKMWNNENLSDKPGLTVTDIVNGCGEKIKLLYIMGENPMISDPDINHAKHQFEKLDFLVVQDIFLTETAELADVVLPAAAFAEKDGTFTNTERRVQRVRKAVEPVGQAKPDWEIISELSKRLGFKNNFNSAKEIMDEIASVTPSYGGIRYDRLESLSGLSWPCPTGDHEGTKILHTEKFARANGKALFQPAIFSEPKEQPDADYPFVFTTGRILYHYHTRTMTGKSEGLNEIAGNAFIEINPEDASRLKIDDQAKIKVSSRRGELIASAHITDKLSEGIVFMPFHFADGAANLLTNPVVDEIAKIPELKVCACKLEKI